MPKSKVEHTHFFDLEDIEFTDRDFSVEEHDYLNSICKRSAKAKNLEELMELIYEMSVGMFPDERLSLAFIKDAGRRMVTLWSKAEYSPMLIEKGYTTELGRTSLTELLEKGGIRITNDFEAFLNDNPNSETTQLLVEEGRAHRGRARTIGRRGGGRASCRRPPAWAGVRDPDDIGSRRPRSVLPGARPSPPSSHLRLG